MLQVAPWRVVSLDMHVMLLVGIHCPVVVGKSGRSTVITTGTAAVVIAPVVAQVAVTATPRLTHALLVLVLLLVAIHTRSVPTVILVLSSR